MNAIWGNCPGNGIVSFPAPRGTINRQKSPKSVGRKPKMPKVGRVAPSNLLCSKLEKGKNDKQWRKPQNLKGSERRKRALWDFRGGKVKKRRKSAEERLNKRTKMKEGKEARTLSGKDLDGLCANCNGPTKIGNFQKGTKTGGRKGKKVVGHDELEMRGREGEGAGV